MHLLKRIGRILIISLCLVLAAFGIGFFGVNHRESFMNKENRIEMIVKKEDDENDECDEDAADKS